MNNNKTIKVLLASPSYDGRFDVRFMTSLFYTQQECIKNNIILLPYFLCYDSLIQRARNEYFHCANTSDVDVLFFIDSDIGWEAKDFIKLVLSEHDMIGATYRKKQDIPELYAFKALEDPIEKSGYKLKPDENGILEVFGLGCGFLKISKNCFKQLWENENEFYLEKNNSHEKPIKIKNICDCVVSENNHFISEDIVMCNKWRKLGNKVYLDTNINCTHVGYKEYSPENLKNWLSNWETTLSSQKEEINNQEFSDKQENEFVKKIEKYFSNDLENDNNSNQNINNIKIENDIFNVL